MANAPFISHMRPDVLGIKSLYENADPRGWAMTTDSEAGKLWATLRSVPETEYLGLSIPRFLARLPYGADTEPLEAFNFEEFDGEPSHDAYVWANSCFIAGLLLAQSYREYGWEMGQRLMQDVEGLPLHVYKHDGESVYTSCAEVQLTDNAVDQLMEYGLMPLVSYKNTDHVKLARIQSVTDPVTKLKARWN
jgi:type VI secretion system protein ImpC